MLMLREVLASSLHINVLSDVDDGEASYRITTVGD